VDDYVLERGIDENSTGLGAKPKVEWFSIKVLRRKAGLFSPYPSGTWRVFSLNASNNPCGEPLHGGLFSCSETKSVSRHARKIIVHTAYVHLNIRNLLKRLMFNQSRERLYTRENCYGEYQGGKSG